MGDWNTLATFVTDDIVRVDVFDDIKDNLEGLKDPLYADQNLPGSAFDAWTSASSLWTNIDADYYHLDFESYGNDLMIVANIRFSHSAALGEGDFGFTLDGTFLGGTSGLGGFLDLSNGQITCQVHYISTASAGAHTIAVQVKNVTAGNTEMWKNSCLQVWVTEL